MMTHSERATARAGRVERYDASGNVEYGPVQPIPADFKPGRGRVVTLQARKAGPPQVTGEAITAMMHQAIMNRARRTGENYGAAALAIAKIEPELMAVAMGMKR